MCVKGMLDIGWNSLDVHNYVVKLACVCVMYSDDIAYLFGTAKIGHWRHRTHACAPSSNCVSIVLRAQ